MDLYLVRHGVAYDADMTRWPDDRERPLTPEGEKRFKRAARGLTALMSSVDVLLSSRYVRAWRTAELLEKEASWPKPVQCEALEGGAAPPDVLQALQAYASSDSVGLVGHEPGMHELLSYLLTADTGHVQVDFRKGGVARLEISEGLQPGTARLRWFLPPRVLRAIDVA
jgi:phosphohistidine phosphatase